VGGDRLAPGSVGGEILAAGGVGSTHLADGAVTAEKIASGAVERDHLAPGSVGTEQLGEASVTGDKIARGAVTFNHLAEGSVGGAQLQAGSVGAGHLADGAVTTAKLASGVIEALAEAARAAVALVPGAAAPDRAADAPDVVEGGRIADGAITDRHIADEAITDRHVRDYSLPSSKLAFNPVEAPEGGATVLQQFGLAPFAFAGPEEQIEVALPFDEPYADDQYALTVTADQPAVIASIKEKHPEYAVVTVSRLRIGPAPNGTLNWIAAGFRS
jgi:hypothetical protein